MCLQNVYTGGVQLYRFVHCGTLLGLTMSHPGRGSDRSDPSPPWSLGVGADPGWRRSKDEGGCGERGFSFTTPLYWSRDQHWPPCGCMAPPNL